jgi:hypothetical protein
MLVCRVSCVVCRGTEIKWGRLGQLGGNWRLDKDKANLFEMASRFWHLAQGFVFGRATAHA